MTNVSLKHAFATLCGCALWATETWFLVDAAGYALTPTVAAIPVATAVLAGLPLWLQDAKGSWVRLAMVATFVFLAGHVLASVVERTGGAVDAKVSQAETASEGRKLLETELAAARERLADAEAEVKRESRNGGCKTTCQAWRKTEAERRARVDTLVAELKTMPTHLIGDSVAHRIALMTGLQEATVSLWRPVMLPFGCMVGIWCLFAFGLHREPVQAITERQEPLTDPEIEELRRVLRGTVRPLNNGELAARMGVSPAEASKRVTDAVAAGLVSRTKAGREVQVSLLN